MGWREIPIHVILGKPSEREPWVLADGRRISHGKAREAACSEALPEPDGAAFAHNFHYLHRNLLQEVRGLKPGTRKEITAEVDRETGRILRFTPQPDEGRASVTLTFFSHPGLFRDSFVEKLGQPRAPPGQALGEKQMASIAHALRKFNARFVQKNALRMEIAEALPGDARN